MRDLLLVDFRRNSRQVRLFYLFIGGDGFGLKLLIMLPFGCISLNSSDTLSQRWVDAHLVRFVSVDVGTTHVLLVLRIGARYERGRHVVVY